MSKARISKPYRQHQRNGGGVNRNVIINGAMNVAQRGTFKTGIGASIRFCLT